MLQRSRSRMLRRHNDRAGRSDKAGVGPLVAYGEAWLGGTTCRVSQSTARRPRCSWAFYRLTRLKTAIMPVKYR